MLGNIMSGISAFFIALCIMTAPSVAQSVDLHRLVPSDTVQVMFPGEDATVESKIDADGFMALPEIGRLHAAGKTVEDLQEQINSMAAASGIYAEPRAIVAVVSYAPILVVGDIRSPGSVEFRSGVTAFSAVGLAGGVSVAAYDEQAMSIIDADLIAESRKLDEDLVRLHLRAARIEAQLKDESTIPREKITEAREKGAGLALEIETAILKNDIIAAREMIALWEQGLEETETQIQLLSDRIASQESIVALQEAELARVTEIVERGLRPRDVLLSAERFVTESRARLLEIEQAYSQALNVRTNRQQDLVHFKSRTRAEHLKAQRETLTQIENNRAKFRAIREKRALVGGMSLSSGVARFVRRNAEGVEESISGDDLLQPGDVLTVIVMPTDGEPT